MTTDSRVRAPGLPADLVVALRSALDLWQRTGRLAPLDALDAPNAADTHDTHDALAQVAALALGGLGFAAALVATRHPDLAEADAKARVIDSFCAVLDAPAHVDPTAHAVQVAQTLIDTLSLDADPHSLCDVLRLGLLIDEASLEELPEAVLGAMRLRDWALALRGLNRLHDALGAQTPRTAFGWAGLCLHHLGRYAEADAWIREGLGEQAALLTIPPVVDEATLRARWRAAGHADDAPPVVSIVCTTFNHARYVESALRGFLSQDCPYPFEILIHDDASTDGTQAVIRRWQAEYPTVIKPVLQVQNQFSRGVRPFELLLARAGGEFIATCEGDDFWIDAAKLRIQVDFLRANPAFSCSAHNYHHFLESALTVRPWTRIGRDFTLSERQLMNVQAVLWLPTLVFRKTFTVLPPERDAAAIGDQFLTSYLGTQGRCMYFETLHAAVRRENEFSLWSPLSQEEKERRRIRTWAALALMHARLGHRDAVGDLRAKIAASPLEATAKAAILDAMVEPQPRTLAVA